MILKITGGIYRGQKIKSRSKTTKPTSQMIREVVFNVLYEINGVGLDLFGGSGLYGFEGLSRGLSFVYFNDFDVVCVKDIKENAIHLNLLNKIKITNLDYKKALHYYQKENIKFDLCFLDPPYDFKDDDILYILTSLNKTQNKGLRIVFETAKNKNILEVSGLSVKNVKIHGVKKVVVYEKK